jgi:hypothetical protein
MQKSLNACNLNIENTKNQLILEKEQQNETLSNSLKQLNDLKKENKIELDKFTFSFKTTIINNQIQYNFEKDNEVTFYKNCFNDCNLNIEKMNTEKASLAEDYNNKLVELAVMFLFLDSVYFFYVCIFSQVKIQKLGK